ncbi:uncharacterized protein LOC141891824 isoform X2 [Acropora palmata]|uniref:uncharacterized protein LOC141891824 isoform X2 n=1 Tax=Acropora palmata TaxID=6131 RepID=UPI003D9FF937
MSATAGQDLREYLLNLVKALKSLDMITEYLRKDLEIDWSVSTLKRRLQEFDVKYYRKENPMDVFEAVLCELDSARKNIGIRTMQMRLRIHHNLLITRDDVHHVMTILDYPAMQMRKKGVLKRRVFYSKGSNWVWSVDGNDKLKNFGLYIHGAMDTFSRRLLWLHIYTSNKDPRVIAHYYFKFIKEEKVFPCCTRSDHGAEVSILAQCQIFLRRNHEDENALNEAHRRGPSQLNQELQEEGLFDQCKIIDRWCLCYTYLPLLEQELQELKQGYNSHKIRKQRGKLRPDGIPDDMYFFPERFGGEEQGFEPCDEDLLEIDRQHNLDVSLPSPVPLEVNLVCDKWRQEHCVEVNHTNVRMVYEDLRQYLNSNV